MYKILLRRQVKESISWGPAWKQISWEYRTYNLLHKDKAHSGIRSTNLGWFTTQPEGRYRKSTKSMSRHYWSAEEHNWVALIKNSENRPCKRLISGTNRHEHNLRTGCNPLLAPISHTDRHKQSFIQRAAWLSYFNEHSKQNSLTWICMQ
jgi:hypothetical protein